MKTIIFGGTGNIGKIIAKMLSDAGMDVCIITRQNKEADKNIKYVKGNVLEENTFENFIEQNDQIIIALGFNNSDNDTMSRGTENIINVMKRKNSKRLICLSAHGAGDSWDYMPEEFKQMVMNDDILKASFKDHGIQEEYVKNSELDWTIIRPTEVMDLPASNNYTVNNPLENSIFQISKYDVADFVVKELKDPKHIRQTVLITN